MLTCSRHLRETFWRPAYSEGQDAWKHNVWTPGISRMSRWGCSIPSIALQKVLYETFVYDLESCWISCCHNKVLSRFYLVFWWEYFLLFLQLQVHCYLVNTFFAFSHRSRSTKHEQISSRCASSQKEKGAAAIICTAVRAFRVQTIRLETLSREWNYPRWTDMPTVWSLPWRLMSDCAWSPFLSGWFFIKSGEDPKCTLSPNRQSIFNRSELCLNTWLPVCLSVECPVFSPDLQWLKLEVLWTHQNREARPTGSFSIPTFCHSFSLFLCVCAQCSDVMQVVQVFCAVHGFWHCPWKAFENRTVNSFVCYSKQPHGQRQEQPDVVAMADLLCHGWS